MATLNPGVYYLNGGGFSMSGNANLTAIGVMLYNAGPSGNISITGNGSVTMSPPTSGTYQGISVFQNRTVNSQVAITGNGSLNLTGSIYAPDANLTVTGNGSNNVMGSQFISYDLTVTGNGGVNVNSSASSMSATRSYGLVE